MPNKSDWLLKFITYGVGCITVFLGMAVIIGWHWHLLFIVQISPDWIAMQYNTAICFILGGLSLIALNTSAIKISRVLTFSLLILSGLTALQYFLNHDLGLDRLFIRLFFTTLVHHPGRMALNTSLSFLFIGLILLWFTNPYAVSEKKAEVSINLIIIGFILILLVNLIAAFTMHYGIPNSMKMSFSTQLGFFILSLGLISLTYQNRMGEKRSFIAPILVIFVFLVISLCGWQSLVKSQYDYLNKLLQLKTQSISDYLSVTMQERASSFLRMSYRWMTQNNTLENAWRADATHYIKDQPGYVAIAWADKDYIVRWIVPETGNERMKDFNLMRDPKSRLVIEKSLAQRQLQMSHLVNFIKGDRGIMLLSPLFKKEQFDGLIIGAINTQIMMSHLLHSSLMNDYELKIYSDGQLLYDSENKDFDLHKNWTKRMELLLLGQTWQIELWPSDQLLQQIMGSWLPLGTLLVGIFIALLAGLLIRVLQQVRDHSAKLNDISFELADTNERLNGILEGSTDLIAAMDLNYNFIAFNNAYKEEIYKLLKVNLQKGMNFSVLMEKMTPENREKSFSLWQKALQGQPFTVIESFDDKRFSDLDFEIHFNPICNARGELVGASHTTTNIFYRLQNEKRLRASKKELEQMVLNLEKLNRELGFLEELMSVLQSSDSRDEMIRPISTFIKMILSPTSGVIYFIDSDNGNMLKETYCWGSPISHQTEIMKSDCWALLRGKMHQVARNEKLVVCEHVGADLEQIAVCICHPLYAQGLMFGLIYMEIDVEEESLSNRLIYLFQILAEQISLTLYNINLREELRLQITHDALTGLYNRRFFEEYLEKELLTAERTSSSFSIVLVDIDHFKRINDKYGHVVGDKVLQSVGLELHNQCRKSDVICRWQGKEFLLFLRESSLDDAASKAELMRQSIENLIIETDGERMAEITISIGIAVYPLDGKDLDDLIIHINEALYMAKKQGGNRVSICGEKAKKRKRGGA
ncbi:sensor domain-containing diguanylate cyclase [Legionella fallonii]|uniref:diguanylate cyclase n=1 Tax=Legionella fallonii LLAP-10 TaxID=1212491 RepID=A0A098G7K9_9GAMM|nr:diguanylate cyclase [Legionella fallonii]CEG58442.1 putative Diguanylate cyclase [Legionella fallonii LLAP-10]